MTIDDDFPYDDILDFHYEGVPNRQHMSDSARGAQFAPFAALTGHDEAIAETARLTSTHIDMSLDELKQLSDRLNYAMSITPSPTVSVTYFKPDEIKRGGVYVSVIGTIKKIEPNFNSLTMVITHPSPQIIEIPLEAIRSISGDVFTQSPK